MALDCIQCDKAFPTVIPYKGWNYCSHCLVTVKLAEEVLSLNDTGHLGSGKLAHMKDLALQAFPDLKGPTQTGETPHL